MLQELQAGSDQQLSVVASELLAVYSFPVESVILLGNGSILHHINANDLMDISDEQGSILNAYVSVTISVVKS